MDGERNQGLPEGKKKLPKTMNKGQGSFSTEKWEDKTRKEHM